MVDQNQIDEYLTVLISNTVSTTIRRSKLHTYVVTAYQNSFYRRSNEFVLMYFIFVYRVSRAGVASLAEQALSGDATIRWELVSESMFGVDLLMPPLRVEGYGEVKEEIANALNTVDGYVAKENLMMEAVSGSKYDGYGDETGSR